MMEFDIFNYFLNKHNLKLVNIKSIAKSTNKENFNYKVIGDNTVSELLYYLAGDYFRPSDLVTECNYKSTGDIYRLVDNLLLKFTIYKVTTEDRYMFSCELIKEITDEQVKILRLSTIYIDDIEKELIEEICNLDDDIICVEHMISEGGKLLDEFYAEYPEHKIE